jgi:hypothetical protein
VIPIKIDVRERTRALQKSIDRAEFHAHFLQDITNAGAIVSR